MHLSKSQFILSFCFTEHIALFASENCPMGNTFGILRRIWERICHSNVRTQNSTKRCETMSINAGIIPNFPMIWMSKLRNYGNKKFQNIVWKYSGTFPWFLRTIFLGIDPNILSVGDLQWQNIGASKRICHIKRRNCIH